MDKSPEQGTGEQTHAAPIFGHKPWQVYILLTPALESMLVGLIASLNGAFKYHPQVPLTWLQLAVLNLYLCVPICLALGGWWGWRRYSGKPLLDRIGLSFLVGIGVLFGNAAIAIAGCSIGSIFVP